MAETEIPIMTTTSPHATPAHTTLVPIRAFRTPVRGYAFAAPPPGQQRPAPGSPAELAREPDNPADPLAVAVWATPPEGARWRIGYLDRGVAARVAPRLDAGSRVRAQLDGWSSEPDGRWRRPLLLLFPDDTAEADRAAGTAGTGQAAGTAETGGTAQTGDIVGTGDPAGGPSGGSVAPLRATSAPSDAPRIWGRPPGVRRRRVS